MRFIEDLDQRYKYTFEYDRKTQEWIVIKEDQRRGKRPILPHPPRIHMDSACVMLNEGNICNIASEVIKTGAYVMMNGEACIFTGTSGLLRFKIESMADLGRELIDIADTWNTRWTAEME